MHGQHLCTVVKQHNQRIRAGVHSVLHINHTCNSITNITSQMKRQIEHQRHEHSDHGDGEISCDRAGRTSGVGRGRRRRWCGWQGRRADDRAPVERLRRPVVVGQLMFRQVALALKHLRPEFVHLQETVQCNTRYDCVRISMD